MRFEIQELTSNAGKSIDSEPAINYNGYIVGEEIEYYRVYIDNSNEENASSNAFLSNFIANAFLQIEDFYVNLLGYKRPTKTDKSDFYGIYLKLHSEYTKISDGVTNYDDLITNPDGIESESTFIINIKKQNTYSVDDLNYILSICVHEYYHGVQASYNVDEPWISESTATFMTLYYMDIFNNIQCTPLEIRYAELVNAFNETNWSLCENESSWGPTDSTYGAMLFFAYLYEKFDSIDFMKNIITSYFNPSKRWSFINRIAEDLNIDHDDLFFEFQIYRSFPSVKYTKISNDYKSLWGRNAEVLSFLETRRTLKVYGSVFYKLSGFSDLSKIVNHCITLNKTSGIGIYILQKNDNDTLVINQLGYSSGNRFSFVYDGLTLSNTDIYLLFIDYNNPSNSDSTIIINRTPNIINDSIHIYNCDNSMFNLNSLLPGNREVIVINNSNRGYYEFELNNFLSGNESVLELYDSNVELLNKCNQNDGNYSKSYGNSLKLVSYVPSSFNINGDYAYPCYLRIKRGNSISQDTKLIVNDVRKNNDLNTSQLNSLVSFENVYGDKILKIKNSLFCNLNLQITVDNIVNNLKVYIINVNRKSLECNNSTYELTSDQNEIISNISCVNERDIYIVFTNCDNISISISTITNLANEYPIILDKNGVDNSLIGTEVTLNNGSREANTIMVGLTRCAFLGDDAPTDSRLEYDWFSSDERVLKVSPYGTITAVGVGTAYIQTRCKLNYKYSTVCINVYPDENTELHYITLKTDMRFDSSQVGTEVSSGMGEIDGRTIHLGKTRLASLSNDAPSNLIQDYTWESSNANIARISSYGTITAITKGFVTITCTYKYNPNYVGSMIIEIV